MKIKRKPMRRDQNNNIIPEPETDNPNTIFYRPKQKWVGGKIKDGGKWVKETNKKNA